MVQPNSNHLQEWVRTDDHTIHRLFEQQADKTPNAIAIIYGKESLTYQQLNQRANQLAHYLRGCEVGPDTQVGIYTERSIEMVVGMLGTLKAGGCYVPLDPTYPQERLAFMAQDARMKIVLTQEGLNTDYLPAETTAFLLDTDWKVIENESMENVPSSVDPTDLAYIIYTSGSTGIPKGVMIPHRAISNHMLWMQEESPLHTNDRVLQKTPFGFDASIWEFYAPLLAGATLVLAQPGGHRDSAYLVQTIIGQQITILQVVPSQLQMLLEEPAFRQCHSLRRVFCGGEALSADLQNRFFACSIADLYNLYGPTETTIDATFWLCERASDRYTVPIGRPISNMQVFLLDASLQPVPFGEPGEIFISGPGVARGYLNRPELTAERFIYCSFDGERELLLYRTGDLGRYLLDENIEFLGRIDQQVKSRGFRIELGEIEATLKMHPAVQECAVVVYEFALGDKRLVAYLVGQTGQTPDLKEIRNFLQARLPEYMLPAAFLVLDTFPYLPNGKLDRKSLPVPDLSQTEHTGTYVAPRNPMEEIIAGIWAEVLRVHLVGIHDSFDILGGHSLLATLVLSRLREAFQVELSFHDFFASPTVAGLATIITEKVSQGQAGEAVTHVTSIRPVPRTDPLPLSFSQERVCFIQQLNPTNISYNYQTILRFTGLLDVTVLERSLSEIIRRHEILRTTFPQVEGSLVQRIHPAWIVILPLVDLRGVAEDEQECAAQHVIHEEIRKPFDYTQLPLIRWKLLQLSTTEHILLHMEYHLVHDGWSFNLFLRELFTLYRAFTAGEPSPLPELPIQFADFAQWQRAWMQSEVAATQLAYWREVLTGSAPLLALPTDYLRPNNQSFHGGVVRIDLPEDLCEAVRALSRQEGVTLFTTLLSAFFVLLFRYSGQEDINVGSAIANRRWRETEHLIGMMVNNVVLRANLSGTPTFRELLTQIRKVTLDAYAHQDVPFDKVVEALQPERTLGYNPLFQVMFSFHDTPLPEIELPGLSLHMIEGVNNGSAKFDLNIVCIPRAEQQIGKSASGGSKSVTMIWEYSSDLFEESTINRMIGHFRVLLEAVVTSPTAPISHLPLLTQEEEQQLLVFWNHTQCPYPQDQCLHQLVEAQVERTPNAVAVIFGEDALSYQQLNERANQLAHRLLTLGIAPDTLVGIALDRSLDMVVAVLAILKVGGAYVPMDLTYPRERLAFMIEDANLTILLTEQRFAEQLPSEGRTLLCLDHLFPTLSVTHTENPKVSVRPEHLAYVLYTSGSTGRPKGVMIPHRAVVNLLTSIQHEPGIRPEDRLLAITTLSFDIAVLEIFLPLVIGAHLIVESRAVATDGHALKEELIKWRPTIMQATPATWHLLLAAGWQGDPQLKLFCGGESLPIELARSLLDKASSLWNMYGPTETTIYSSIGEVQADQTPMTIGRPIANTRIYVLDQHQRLAPVGVPGEMYIGGAGLARGYLHRPELTTERFIADPFISEQGQRLYRTGDRVRYLPDGRIEFLGRQDYQIKLRGFRIELGEIEAVLVQHEGIHDAKVLLHEDGPADQRLVAYSIRQEGVEVTREELQDYLQTKLPAYMVPATFVMVETFPLTPNGKIDRNALLSLHSHVREERTSLFVAPRNIIEAQVARLFEEVLHTHPVSVNADFFAMGGHSLSAMHLLGQIQKVFGRAIPLSLFFQEATIEHMTNLLYEHQDSMSYSPLVGIQPHGSRPPLFCIHSADGNVFDYVDLAHHLGSDQPVYAIEESFLSEEVPLITTIKEMAEYYIDVLYAKQPTGPYYLCGYSMGGAIAFEMTQLLYEQGQEVALLCLLDTSAPITESKRLQEEDDAQIITWMAEELAVRQPGFSKKLLTGRELRQLSPDEQWQYLLEVAIAVNYISKRSSVEPLQRQVRIYRKNAQASMVYKPRKTYNHIITVLRATEKTPYASSYIDFTREWQEFSSLPLEVHDVPGHHFSIMREPHIQILAEEVSCLLDRAQQLFSTQGRSSV